ncbi:BPSL0761 family protein [Deefgea rivuli]|uniref:BPSL0761 family protein n=1 Tax=Deefgea rivuli TaxID=400948 RepID=UPI000482AC07|nr:BPSL0761 family protein [Deefgea rivuli]
MTTAAERTISILTTLQLLDDLRARTDVPEELRARAEQALRHFPRAGDIASLAKFCDQHTLAPHVFCVEDPSTSELAKHFKAASKFDFK